MHAVSVHRIPHEPRDLVRVVLDAERLKPRALVRLAVHPRTGDVARHDVGHADVLRAKLHLRRLGQSAHGELVA